MINVLDLRDTNKVCGPGKTILETAARIDPARFHVVVGLLLLDREDAEQNLYWQACRKRDVHVEAVRLKHQFDPGVVRRTIELVKRHDIHIIHSHDYKTDILAFLVARSYRIPIITTIHGWIVTNWKSRLYIAAGKRVLPYFDQVIAVSPLIQRQLQALGVPPERAPLVYNAIVAENYQADRHEPGFLRRRFDIPVGARVIGNIGRLSPEKGQDVFLRAAARVRARHPDVYFVLVGDGRDRPRLERMVAELGLTERVRFTGHQQDVRPVFQDIDMLALTSYTEGFPNVLLESLCMQRPILATAVGGVPDIVEDGVTGVLVQPGDHEAVASGLCRMLEDGEAARRMLANGYQRVMERFQFGARVARMEALYQELLGQGAGPLRTGTAA